uniref:Transglutaminase-like domain-containing protein n=1 Tax=Octactis speculum TaxID=3111310 RepID=A0A7S2BQR0_9STRA
MNLRFSSLILAFGGFFATTTIAECPGSWYCACADNTIPYPPDECRPVLNATNDAIVFLSASLPPWDVVNAASLGFPTAGAPDIDGLNYGILQPTVNLSLVNRAKLSWAADVPEAEFNDYVLPYASVNEARSNWRPLLRDALLDTVLAGDALLTSDVVTAVNSFLWSDAALSPNAPIVFKSSMTPLVYDPMSVLAFGYASCTGVSILFVDALRSVGVAARLVGTPAWNGVAANGNHNWVEVYDPENKSWGFIEAAPAGGGETLTDPCDKWFCNPSHVANGTQFFAARWDSEAAEGTVYPMAWDLDNLNIPGVDRTDYYATACAAC